MRILITGAAGFIGFSLAKRLLGLKKIKVYGIDNMNSYYNVDLKKQRLNLLKKNKNFNFELIDIFPQPTHGGSMRYVISRKNVHSINQRVAEGLLMENKNNLDNLKSCLEFKKNCEISKEKIIKKLKKFKNEGKKICGYAATSKSTTILNYCNLDKNIINFICDTTKEKIGKFSPGTHIPIVPASHFHQNLPDVAYLFAWNHKEEIFAKEKDFIKKGGQWISHVSI